MEPSSKTVNVSAASPGTPLTYTITLRNISEADVSKVVVTDTVPISLTYTINSLSATAGSYDYANGVITWTGSVNAGGAVTITFGATISETATPFGSIVNSAVISGGGEIITRTATVAVEPQRVYLPIITRNYCPPYADDFSDPGSGWPIVDTGNIQLEYLNGEYRILVKSTHWGVRARPGFKASNYIVAVDVRNVTGVYGSYGIIFGFSDDWTQGYSFEIYPNGNYDIWRRNSTSSWTLLASGSSGHINTGTVTNRLEIERNGSLIRAYANGQLLTSVSDGSYTGLRHVGLTVFSYSQPNVDARFDNFTVTCGAAATALSGAGETPDGAAMEVDLSDNWESGQNRKSK